jgi:uncharacterized protein YgiM (DUF1202 family)
MKTKRNRFKGGDEMSRRFLILVLAAAILLVGCANLTNLITRQEPAKVWIKVGQANIRTAATVEGKILVTLKEGDKLKVLAKERSWYKVRLSDKRVGWVHRSVVTPDKP